MGHFAGRSGQTLGYHAAAAKRSAAWQDQQVQPRCACYAGDAGGAFGTDEREEIDGEKGDVIDKRELNALSPQFQDRERMRAKRGSKTVMTESCPICGSGAKRGHSRRDAIQVECRRCGWFEITGTALVMLNARIENDELRRARASHAIRSQSTPDRWLQIDSTNVGDLIEHSLPGVGKQIENLLEWTAEEVRDDRLAAVELPQDLNLLAGKIGAVNDDRVDQVVRMAQRDGLIEDVPDDCIRLTLKGWKMIEELPKRSGGKSRTTILADNTEDQSKSDEKRSDSDIVSAICPKCEGERKANVVGEYSKRWEHDELVLFSINTYRILECCGCETIFIQHEFVFSEDEEIIENPITGEFESHITPRVNYWPQVSARKRPDWTVKLEDEVIQRLFDEVYKAIDHSLGTIAAMGIRAIVDRLTEIKGANPGDTFAKKISELQKSGSISKNQEEILVTMTDAGSAASHRGWKPSKIELDQILDATENLVHGILFVARDAKSLKGVIPPRPSR